MQCPPALFHWGCCQCPSWSVMFRLPEQALSRQRPNWLKLLQWGHHTVEMTMPLGALTEHQRVDLTASRNQLLSLSVPRKSGQGLQQRRRRGLNSRSLTGNTTRGFWPEVRISLLKTKHSWYVVICGSCSSQVLYRARECGFLLSWVHSIQSQDVSNLSDFFLYDQSHQILYLFNLERFWAKQNVHWPVRFPRYAGPHIDS